MAGSTAGYRGNLKRKTINYLELLKDPRWQKLRLKVFERDGWQCVVCGDKEKTLTVHHHYYIFGKKPWEYEEESLSTMCMECHEEEQVGLKLEMDTLKQTLGRRGFRAGDILSLSTAIHGYESTLSPADFTEILEWSCNRSSAFLKLKAMWESRHNKGDNK
jgi:hypothetical protein